MRALVELSGESLPLARAEAAAAAESLGGSAPVGGPPELPEGLIELDLPDHGSVVRLAERLALAHRCLVPLGGEGALDRRLEEEGRSGRSAAVRPLRRPSVGGADPRVASAGAAYKRGGGRIDLERPERRFWILDGAEPRLYEEAAPVDRRAVAARRMPAFPFRRPVSLPPRLARAAVNLARIRPGDSVLDPFLGTGALLGEAGLLGARVWGIDRDPEMVRGALKNLAHLGLSAEEFVEGDAARNDFSRAPPAFDALVTDVPYGRSSGSGGEPADRVVARVIPFWASRVRSGGRVVIVSAGLGDVLGPPWRVAVRVPVRVHRSLTREFTVYERPAPS